MASAKRLILCPGCNRERPYWAHGLCNSCYRKQWRRLNPDATKAASKWFYDNNKEAEKARFKRWETANREDRKTYHRKLFAGLSWESRTLKKGEASRVLSRKELSEYFLCSLREATINCPSCGIELDYSTSPRNGKRKQNAASLDKIVPSLGYTQHNVAIICWRCNRLKNCMTLDDLKMLTRYVETYTETDKLS